MAGYIRQDVTNNIATGNVINASDFDNEYNAIEAAFHATTGHTHDGTAAEGAPITKIGPTQDVVASASALTPKTDNTVDLGSSILEYKDLWIDGTANIDSLVADTADINGGTIDGVTIGGASAGAATFTTATATTGNITTVNATTVDTTNIEVTTLKAKDGTSAGSIADSTGVVTLASSVLTTTDINGGTIDGVTIGGASAGAGTFTTATATTGNITTVNATTVDTTNLEVTNIKAKDGTASASIADATGVVSFSANPVLSGGTANGVAYLNASKVLTTGSALTFDGSVLGVNNAGDSDFKLTTNNTGSGSTDGLLLRINSTGSEAYLWNWEPSSVLIFGANAAEQMRLTSTGLGIGTSSPSDKLDVFGGKIRHTLAGGGVQLVLGNSLNAVSLGSVQANGDASLAFYTNTSTERMRLDSSGNLGLGVVPSAWGAAYPGRIQGLGWSIATPLDGGTDTAAFATNAYNSAGSTWNYRSNASAALYQQFSGQHRFYIAPSGTAGNAISFTQAMTLDASGRLGIGVTNPAVPLQVQTASGSPWLLSKNGTDEMYVGVNASLNTPSIESNTAIRFATGASYLERARITSGGDLLVGTTTGAGIGITAQPSSTTIQNNNAQATGFVFTSYRRSSTEIGSITQNGTTAVLFNTTSDRRLKDNITPAPSASAVVDAIEIVSHDWKSAPDEHVTYGVIAQDLALVAPQAVLQGDDGDEIERTWGVDYSKLVPMLIKEIQSLRQRVSQLEQAE